MGDKCGGGTHQYQRRDDPLPSTSGPRRNDRRSPPCPRAAQVKAHKTGLAHLVLSRSGKLLASSSARGTLLRVFDVESAKHLYSFRRGLTAAQVHSISFNRNETMLCGHFDEMLYGNLLFLFLVVVVVLLACVPRPYA